MKLPIQHKSGAVSTMLGGRRNLPWGVAWARLELLPWPSNSKPKGAEVASYNRAECYVPFRQIVISANSALVVRFIWSCYNPL